jgi:hypothetical protein
MYTHAAARIALARDAAAFFDAALGESRTNGAPTARPAQAPGPAGDP